MQIAPSLGLNRQKHRALNAHARRMSRQLSCGPSCSNGVEEHPILDRKYGDSGLRKFAGVTSALGETLSIKPLVQSANDFDTPVLIRRVQTLTAILCTSIMRFERERWYDILRESTSFAFADMAKGVASKVQNQTPDDAFIIGVCFTMFTGAISLGTGEKENIAVGYLKVFGDFDKATMDLSGPARNVRKAAGLAGLGSISGEKSLTCAPWDQYGGWTDNSKVDKGNERYRAKYNSEPPAAFSQAIRDRNPCNDSHIDAIINKYPPSAADRACKESLKTGEDWIVDTKCYVDTQNCRDEKIQDVRNAFQQVKSRAATNCDINYYTQFSPPDNWVSFIAAKESAGRPAATEAQKQNPAFNAIGNFFDDVKSGLSNATDYLLKFIVDLGNKASDLLCKAFKALFGESVGGVLCSIVTFVIRMVTGGIQAGLLIFKVMITGVIDFGTDLFNKQWMQAFKDILSTVTKVLILSSSTFAIGTVINTYLGIPVSKIERQEMINRGAKPDDVPSSLEEIADQVAQDDPFFALAVIMAAVAVIITPTPQSIGGLVGAFAPAVAAVYAPILKLKFATQLKDYTVIQIRKALAAIVKIAGLVTSLVLNIGDFIQKIWDGLKRYYKRFKTDPASELARLGNSVKDSLTQKVNSLWENIKAVKLAQAGKALISFFDFLPDAIKGFCMEDPDLAEVYTNVAAVVDPIARTVADATKIWHQATEDATAGLKPADKIKSVSEQIADLKSKLSDLCKTNSSDPLCGQLTAGGTTPGGGAGSGGKQVPGQTNQSTGTNTGLKIFGPQDTPQASQQSLQINRQAPESSGGSGAILALTALAAAFVIFKR
jgi:hypothetical protein